MKRRFTLALLVVLALSVGLAGCTDAIDGNATETDGDGVETAGDGAEAEGDAAETEGEEVDTATRLQEQSVAVMEDVDSYRFVMNMSMDLESDEGSGTIDMDATGAANLGEQRMYMDQLTRITAQGETASVDQEAYFVEDSMYIEQLGTWQRQQAPEDMWTNDDVEQQQELLEGAEVDTAGTETIDGVETTVLEVSPDESTLAEMTGGTGSADTGLDEEAMEIETATVRQYVATEAPHYVHRMEMEMGATVEGDPIDVSMTMTLDDLGEDVSIELPEDLPN